MAGAPHGKPTSQRDTIVAYCDAVRTGDRTTAHEMLGHLIELSMVHGSGVMTDSDFHGALANVDS